MGPAQAGGGTETNPAPPDIGGHLLPVAGRRPFPKHTGQPAAFHQYFSEWAPVFSGGCGRKDCCPAYYGDKALTEPSIKGYIFAEVQ
jgi:hypothetical protein